MPIIKKPQEKAIPARGVIDPRAGARAAAAGAGIGFEAIKAGQSQASQGLSMLKQAENQLSKIDVAKKTADYSNRLNQAKLDFSKRVAERSQETVDKDGNPVFDQLPDDVGNIGKDVIKNTLSKIKDPEVADKFKQNFERFVTNKQIMSLGVARQQKLQYINNSVSSGVEGLVNQGIEDDFSNIGYYQNQIRQIVSSAVSAGAITNDQGMSLIKNSNGNLITGKFDSLIKSDPVQAQKILSNLSPEKLSLSQTKYNDLVTRANLGAADQELTTALKKDADQNISTEQQNFNAQQTRIAVQQGTAGTSDIVYAKQKGAISQEQAVGLIKYSIEQQSLRQFETKKMLALSTSIAKGVPARDFSVTDVDKHYKQRLEFIQTEEGGVDIYKKASVASQYGVRVRAFENEMEYHALNNTNIEDHAGAIQAYQYTVKNSPEVVSSMDKKAQAVLTLASIYQDQTSLNAPDAMQRARKVVTTLDTEAGKELSTKFDDEFKTDSDIEDAVTSMFGKTFSGDRVDVETIDSFRKILRSNYVLTGNFDAAKRLTKDQTSALVGRSQFNEAKGLVDDDETIMFLPPEKAFPQFTFEQLQQNLFNSVGTKLPPGVRPEDLRIQSDLYTRTPGKPINYGVYYIDKDGMVVPITQNQDGSTVWRWVPNPETDIGAQKDQELDRLKIERDVQNKVRSELIKSGETDIANALTVKTRSRLTTGAEISRTEQINRREDIERQAREQAGDTGTAQIPEDMAKQAREEIFGDSELTEPIEIEGIEQFKKTAKFDLGRSGAEKTLNVIRKFEGFRARPYWDVNAYRAGYGSDTVTKADGSVVKVKRGMRVSRADAERDLARRSANFANRARSQIGKNIWSNFDENVKAALTSMTYNYGSLPKNVVAAAKTGDKRAIANAVRARASDNRGVNRRRRNEEANLILGMR